MLWYHYIGLLGVALTILAYFLVQTGKIRTDQIMYPLLNIAAGGALLLTTWWEWNLSAVLLNIGWIGVGIYGLVKIRRAKA